MAEKKFRAGDLVQLKSGGPVMTVSAVEPVHGAVYCSWFAGKKLEHGTFSPEMLLKVEEDTPQKA